MIWDAVFVAGYVLGAFASAMLVTDLMDTKSRLFAAVVGILWPLGLGLMLLVVVAGTMFTALERLWDFLIDNDGEN